MAAVRRICRKAILLDKGCITLEGDADMVVDHYLAEARSAATESTYDSPRDPENPLQLLRFALKGASGEATNVFEFSHRVFFEFEFASDVPDEKIIILTLFNSQGVQVMTTTTQDVEYAVPLQLGVGVHAGAVELPTQLLPPGVYTVTITIKTVDNAVREWLHHFFRFQVIDTITRRADVGRFYPAAVAPPIEWTFS